MRKVQLQRHGSVGVLIGLALAFVLGACGKEGGLQWGDNREITKFEELVTDDKPALVGRKVRLQNLTATRAVGDYVFWAGQSATEVPVVLEGELNGTAPENSVDIRRGGKYDVVGTVRLAESVPEDSRIWRLMSPARISEVKRAVIYLGADEVTER